MTRLFLGLIGLFALLAASQASALSIAPPTPNDCRIFGTLPHGAEVWKRSSTMFKTKDGSACYKRVMCVYGSTFTHKGGDTWYCKPDPERCLPFRVLKANEKVWKRSATMFKTRDGACYSRVKCMPNTTFTHHGGDTWFCKPTANCRPFHILSEGEKVWKRSETMYKLRDGRCFTNVKCKPGLWFRHHGGDTWHCIRD